MVLHDTVVGEGPPLVILHGMLGQGRNWGQVAKMLESRYTVHALDLRNHGASAHAPNMDYPAMAQDVAQTLDALGLEESAVLGHSIGGKVAMVLALILPRRVRSLVIVDIAPVTYPPWNLALVRAMRDVDLDGVTRRSDVDASLAASVPESRTRAFLLQSLAATPSGALAWRPGLEAIERCMPELSSFPPNVGEGPYPGPVLLVTGADSDYVRPDHLSALTALFPRTRHVAIAGAGHWVHADQPRILVDHLVGFLAEPRDR